MKNNLIRFLAPIVALAMIATGCGKDSSSSSSTPSSSVSLSGAARGSYADEDYLENYDSSSATTIALSGTSATISGNGAKLDGSTVTISNAGTYVISGELTDGQLLIETTKNDTVHLILNGVTLKNSSTSPFYIKQAEKVILTLAEGSENSITDTENYVFEAGADEPDAALFSKSDLTINGSGLLTVSANYRNGIASKDSLIVTNGIITVTAVNDAIRGKDSVTIADGSFNLTSGGDGIKANNSEDTALGFIIIDGGSFVINAENDGIQAETALVVTNGTFDISCGGGSTASVTQSNNEMGAMPQGDMGSMPQGGPPSDMSGTSQGGGPQGGGMGGQMTGEQQTTTTEEETVSQKGLKGGSSVDITGGVFNLSCVDDTVHSNGNVTLSGGTFTIASDDDGIHADGNLLVTGGNINITQCYEGLEGTTVTVSDGTISIVASDDGINAADASSSETSGRPGAANSNCYITIMGGTVTVDAKGDGLDSNGDLNIEGGLVIVNGPTGNGNGALDYDGSSTVTGGALIAAGSSGMAQAPGNDSTQPVLSVTFSAAQEAGTVVNLADKDGNLIISFTPAKRFQNIVISSPLLKTGQTYTLYSSTSGNETRVNGVAESVETLGSTLCTVTLSNMATSISSDGSTISG
ncbi:MAG TPA: carbohydrate-binding domain-containing protein, partial [Clostridia bacterium]|nr:carbohydrate-binding domain-containing protein [Clostridia bacterium]